MQDFLLVIDMQNDFIDGALGTKEAEAIVPKVEEKIRGFSGRVIFTRVLDMNDRALRNCVVGMGGKINVRNAHRRPPAR